MLHKSAKMVEPIKDEGTGYDPNKHQFFVDSNHLQYKDIEWKHI